MTFWTFAPKAYRWRLRRRANLDFDERKFGLEKNPNHFLKDFYFRLCRSTNVARFFGIILTYPALKLLIWYTNDPSKAEREAEALRKADDKVINDIPIDPVLGNPLVTPDTLADMVSSNYGFDSMIELISSAKKSNEFWEYICYKVDDETDGENWHDYID